MCLLHIRQYESARNGVVVVGFDKLTTIFSDWAERTSKLEFISISDKMNSFSLIDRGLEGIPTSWVPKIFFEPQFDETVKMMDTRKESLSVSAVEMDLINRLENLKISGINKADVMKAELYCLHMIQPTMTEAEEMMLDNQISMRMDEDGFVGFLLNLINLNLLLHGKNQHKVTQKHFLSLKNKFLTILSSIIVYNW